MTAEELAHLVHARRACVGCGASVDIDLGVEPAQVLCPSCEAVGAPVRVSRVDPFADPVFDAVWGAHKRADVA